jgi:hypothetical protein
MLASTFERQDAAHYGQESTAIMREAPMTAQGTSRPAERAPGGQ